MPSPSATSPQWLREDISQPYHGYLEAERQSWPRRLARRWLRTDRYPASLFRLAPTLPRGARVIDVGCGTGRTLETLHRERPDLELFACDLAPVDRLPDGYVRELAARDRFFQADVAAVDHAAPRRQFDLAYSCDTIEHVMDGVAFLRGLQGLVRPGGQVLVQTMNHRGVLVGFYDDPTHVRPYSTRALWRAAEMVGLEPQAAYNDRSWKILLLSPAYHLYCRLRGQPARLSHFWEHLLAVQSVLVATRPNSVGQDTGHIGDLSESESCSES